MARVYIAVGSNMGDRLAALSTAAGRLRDLARRLEASSVYETSPVGGPPGQDRYLNCVIALDTRASLRQLLSFGQRLEEEAGRVRTVRNGPRPLDVDILYSDSEVVDEPDLVVPHPRLYERPFVLAPLEEIAPELVPPGWRQRLAGSGDEDLRLVGKLQLS